MTLALRKEDWFVVGHYLGSILSLVAYAMLFPVVIALLYREFSEIPSFLIAAGGTLAVAEALRLLPADSRNVGGKHAIIITGLSWVLASFAGAIPLIMSGHYASFVDALLEAVSGFTTTGLTAIMDVNHMSMSMNTWRFEMMLIGGQGVLVAALAIGLFSRQSRMAVAMYRSEGREDRVLPSIRETGRFIWRVSTMVIIFATIAGFIAAFISGLSWDRALMHGFWLSVAAFDTGGFTPQGNGLIFYHSALFEFIVTVTGFLGALNFTIYADLSRDRKEALRDIEVRTLVIWLLATLVVAILAMATKGMFTGLGAFIRRGTFTVVAAVSNTGLMIVYPEQMLKLMGAGAFLTIVIAMTIGGCTGSASGGIKMLRVGVIFTAIVRAIKRALMPDSAQSTVKYHHHESDRILTDEDVSAVCMVTALYIIVYVLGAVAGILAGYDAIPAMFESVSAAANNGLSSGIVSPGAPAVLKIIYIVEMLLGRFEFITMFVVITAVVASIIPKGVRQRMSKVKRRRQARRGVSGNE